MNELKLRKIEEGLSGIAKKVLDATPISEAWTRAKICQEMARLGHKPDARVVDGCLESLKSSGLVKEPIVGNWIRVTAKPKPDIEVEILRASDIWEQRMAQAKKQDAKQESKPMDPLEQIGHIAKALRSMAEKATSLATEIEEVGLEAEARLAKVNEDTDKLRQLQALLKSLQ